MKLITTKPLAAAVSFLLLINIKSIAQDGVVDKSFGNNGYVMTQIIEDEELKSSAATDVLALNDGKILASGSYDNFGRNAVTLVRYNFDGSLDQSFGENGIVRSYFAKTQVVGEINGLALQSDGRIIVSGFTTSATDYDFAVMRFNENGSVDSSFGTDGRVLTAIGDQQDYAYDMVVQDDDKILMSGRRSGGQGSDAIIVRYTSEGELDVSFGQSGIVTTDFDGGADEYRVIKCQTDGKIVAGGYSSSFGVSLILARYLSDGSLDTSFDQDGKLKIADLTGQLNSFTFLNQNQILVVGTNGGQDVQLARVNADGSLDNSFGNNGTVTTNFVSSTNDDPRKLLVQNDNKFIVIGTTWQNGPWVMSGQRFNADGSVDNSFGDGGAFYIDLNGQDFSRSNAAAMAQDGSIFIAGRTLTDKRVGIFSVLKIDNNSSPLTSIENSEDITKNYKLHNNYPNPFNPSTTIKFSIPETALVNLKVYNVLGEEVVELVNKELTPGSYETVFNTNDLSNDLSSGVYFYQLNAKNFVQTKKLTLIK